MSRRGEYAASSAAPVVVAALLPAEAAGGLAHLVEAVPDGTTVVTFARGPIEGARALRSPGESGSAALLNEAMATNPGADLVLVSEASRFPVDWLGRLRAAAYADDVVAAAVPVRLGDPPLLDEPSITTPATPPTRPIHPRVFLLHRHCSYLRSTALELVGRFDESLTDPDAVLADYSARCLERGLSVVLADDVLLERVNAAPATSPSTPAPEVGKSYPWLAAVVTEERNPEIGPLRRSLVATRASGRTLSVTIDARSLASGRSGTESYTAGLIAALSNSDRFRVRALVRDDFDLRGAALPESGEVSFIHEQEAKHGVERTDIAHRPQQVFVPEDVTLLRQAGERVLISHLDLIGFRNPSYHATPAEWQRYRRVTRFALGAADRVVFLSEHAKRDAIAEDLIESQWTAVVGAGISPGEDAPSAAAPPGVPTNRPFLLMIGTDYLHKNRLFALELADHLRQRQGWDGLLVLAGKHAACGGSGAAEAELLRSRPELAEQVLDIGPVNEAEKSWLLIHARALLCPSTYEGFGLTPLEAARAETPCIFAATTALREVLNPEAATIEPWDPSRSADRAFPLLHDTPERQAHLRLLSDALNRFTWDSIAGQLELVYREAISSPYRSSVPRAWEELRREQLVVDLDRDRERFLQELRELHDRVRYGLPLVDRGGLLTKDQQRGLIRVASRRWLRGPILGPFGFLGAVGTRPSAVSNNDP